MSYVYPQNCTRDNVAAPFGLISIVTVTLPSISSCTHCGVLFSGGVRVAMVEISPNGAATLCPAHFYCVLFIRRVRIRVRIIFHIWLLSCYAQVFPLHSTIIVALPDNFDTASYAQRGINGKKVSLS